MQSDNINDKSTELERLRSRVSELETELHSKPPHWQASDFYTAYYATTGFLLGMFGAATSLLFNIVGSTLVGQHPLKLIQVFLTFPLGERALQLSDGLTLAIGCCLYIGTGMLLGIPFQVLLSWFTCGKSFGYRLAVGSVLALSMWLVHFYLILAWLQPLLFGGNWIVEQIPVWVPVLMFRHLPEQSAEQLVNDRLMFQFQELSRRYPESFTKYIGATTTDACADTLRLGRQVYIGEGCWHCHSQFVRPVSNDAKRFGQVSETWEYQNELQRPVLFGTRRVGPDLSREANCSASQIGLPPSSFPSWS